MPHHLKLAVAGVALSALLAACSPAADTAATPGAPTTSIAASANVQPFRIGTMQAAALFDGQSSPPNDNSVLGVGRTPAEVSRVLAEAGQPDRLELYRKPLLVRDGDRVMLFDTGMGQAANGRMMASLSEAGVQPAEVTEILISHAHGDHVGGLVDAAGALVFPNATIRISAPEWAAMQANARQADLVRAITPRVQAFQPGAQVIPGVMAVPVQGHTPGHSAYRIGTGADAVLYIGDTAHHFVISVARPDWTIQYDGDKPTAQASRRALFQRAADENQRLYAYHFPMPGVGRVRVQGEGFVWVPETPAQP